MYEQSVHVSSTETATTDADDDPHLLPLCILKIPQMYSSNVSEPWRVTGAAPNRHERSGIYVGSE